MRYRYILPHVPLTVLIWFTFFLPVAEAVDAQRAVRKPLVVRQIRKEQAGVLIARPDPFDERMRDIMVRDNIASSVDYAQWLGLHLSYQRDEGKDEWALPEDTLAKGRGDCEDLAFFNQAALRVLGYEPRVLCMLRAFRSHAICVFKDGDYYRIIDNTRIKSTPARSFEELVCYLFTMYRCASIGEAHHDTHDYQVLFRRKDLVSK